MKTKSTYNWLRDEKNTSLTYHTGSRWETTKSGTVTVLCSFSCKEHRNKKYLVSFNDGTEVLAYSNNIRKGELFNWNTPSVQGTGCVGYGYHKASDKKKVTRCYSMWKGVLIAFSKNEYVGATPYLKKEWKNFQLFCKDIKNIENYEGWLNNSQDYSFRQRNTKNKIFTPEAYIFKKRG